MRRLRSKAVNHGRNSEHVAYRDNRNIRCGNCGFICNMDRDTYMAEGTKAGDGITHAAADAGSGYWTGSAWTGTGYDFSVSAGCPFCGCLLYPSLKRSSR